MSGVLIEGNKHVVNGVEVYDFTYINLVLDRGCIDVCIVGIAGVECEE